MNRKRIRQMNTALLRRLTGRPTAEYFSGQPMLERLESENYIQRFAPLYDGTRLRCGDVLELCRPELAELSGGEPEGLGGCALPMTLPGGSCSRRRRPLRPMTPGRCFSCRFCRCFLPPNGRSCPLTRRGISPSCRRRRRQECACRAQLSTDAAGSGSGSTSMR